MSNDLNAIAKAMVAPGKGILAADESTGTIGKRFDSINVENIEENRRAYRDMLFSTKGIGDHISGVILYDETLRQKSANGTLFSEMLTKLGVLPGIIGCIQSTEILKLILGKGTSLVGRLMLFNALDMKVREVKLRRDPQCPLCGDKPTIKATRAALQLHCAVRRLSQLPVSNILPLCVDRQLNGATIGVCVTQVYERF